MKGFMGVRALLVYPEMPPTYWSMHHALPFLGRKAALPPLGLLTVAAMLPADWNLRVLDENVEPIARSDIEAADLVFASAMLLQKESLKQLISLCRASGKPLVAGGPYPTSCHEEIQGVDHFVLGEAELTLPPFLDDFQHGTLKPMYWDPSRPSLEQTPAPRFDLIDRRQYAGAALQFSRGCPHHCEFCDIVELFGHQCRTKTPSQFIAEMDSLFDKGWRGSLFIVDDNFIGNRSQVRRLLPELARWQKERHFPFSLYTEASLELAADEVLLDEMVRAGFNMVFVGIETPDRATLAAVGKKQNQRVDLLESVHAIQAKGIEVSGGFIVGFDSDQEDIFARQIDFIERAAIPTAMVGLLTALPKTRLHTRLAAEGRLLSGVTEGNNTHDLQLNFLPRMDPAMLRAGYLRVVGEVYRPSRYFGRCFRLICRMKRQTTTCRTIHLVEWRAFFYSLVRQTFTRYAFTYWCYLLRALAVRPRMISEIVAMAVKGHHFLSLTRNQLKFAGFSDWLDLTQADLEVRLNQYRRGDAPSHGNWDFRCLKVLAKARGRCERISADYRASAHQVFENFRNSIEHLQKARAKSWASSRPE